MIFSHAARAEEVEGRDKRKQHKINMTKTAQKKQIELPKFIKNKKE